MSTIQLSKKCLNRTLLHRQLLLERSCLSPLEAIEQLAGLQAQSPKPPYYALWSRLQDFEPSMLSELLLGRDVVRIALMRSTIHLVSARDCLSFRSVLQPVQNRLLMGTHGKALVGVDMERLEATALKLLAESPRTFEELGKLLQEHWPSAAALAGDSRPWPLAARTITAKGRMGTFWRSHSCNSRRVARGAFAGRE